MNIHYHHASEVKSLYFQKDAYGYLKPPLDNIDQVPVYNRMVLNEIVSISKEHLRDKLVAIYFRGSRLTSNNVSDFDTVTITKEHQEDSMSNLFRTRLASRFSNILYFDNFPISLQELHSDRSLQFIVKVLSVRVFGQDVSATISPFKIGRDLVLFIPKLRSKLDWVIQVSPQLNKIEDIRAVANHAIKFSLRAASELVIERSGEYSREITSCCDLFCRYYQDHALYAQKLLEQYDRCSKADFGQLISDVIYFCDFITEEYNRLYEEKV